MKTFDNGIKRQTILKWRKPNKGTELRNNKCNMDFCACRLDDRYAVVVAHGKVSWITLYGYAVNGFVTFEVLPRPHGCLTHYLFIQGSFSSPRASLCWKAIMKTLSPINLHFPSDPLSLWSCSFETCLFLRLWLFSLCDYNHRPLHLDRLTPLWLGTNIVWWSHCCNTLVAYVVYGNTSNEGLPNTLWAVGWSPAVSLLTFFFRHWKAKGRSPADHDVLTTLGLVTL